MRKIIVNLGSKRGKNNYNSSPQITRPHILLLMSIFDTPEKDLSNVDSKYDMRKVRTSSVKLSSTLFYCSMHAMYNIFDCAQKQRLVLKSYIPGINTSVFPRIHYNILFYEN